MSRCFPYPPPGHTLSKASNEALIESIKLQKLKEETKEQRKKEKREKKERRKEKKEKKKEKKEKKEKRKEKKDENLNKSDSAKGDISKKIAVGSECEQLEKSSLTEETGRPVCLRTSSSDSTENSNKRKRNSSSLEGSHPHSKIILVRLPSKKLNDCCPSIKEQQLNSNLTSGRVEKTQNKDLIGHRDERGSQLLPLERTGNITQSLALKTDRVGICSTSGRTEDLPPVKIRKSVPSRKQRLESQYKDLIVNWVPPQLEDACLYSEDVDWLCKSKNQDTRDVKRPKLENEISVMSCSGSSGLWPRAQYLSDDIYALPYTVPF